MPVNEYKCLNCGNIWEEKFSYRNIIEHKTERICPQCGSDCIVKVWNVPSVIYKTDGFYNTDSKKKEDQ